MYYAALAIAIFSSASYHLSIKTQPGAVNPFLPLAVAYLAAFVICVAGVFLWSDGSRALSALRPNVLWLALSVVGIEVGFLLAYRAGWHVGYAALTVNACSTLALLPIALLVFKQQVDAGKIIGVLLNLSGLFLLLRR
jgi:uncharacterized membrane protein